MFKIKVFGSMLTALLLLSACEDSSTDSIFAPPPENAVGKWMDADSAAAFAARATTDPCAGLTVETAKVEVFDQVQGKVVEVDQKQAKATVYSIEALGPVRIQKEFLAKGNGQTYIGVMDQKGRIVVHRSYIAKLAEEKMKSASVEVKSAAEVEILFQPVDETKSIFVQSLNAEGTNEQQDVLETVKMTNEEYDAYEKAATECLKPADDEDGDGISDAVATP